MIELTLVRILDIHYCVLLLLLWRTEWEPDFHLNILVAGILHHDLIAGLVVKLWFLHHHELLESQKIWIYRLWLALYLLIIY